MPNPRVQLVVISGTLAGFTLTEQGCYVYWHH